MKKPMTTADLFNEIKTILKNKNMLPDILDYGIATSKPVPIRIYEFELKNNLDYGGREGIYLDLWIEYYEDNEWLKSDIGTFKTLEDGREAMHAMAGLLADFIIEGTAYINANIDDFTWTGADVWAFDENGKKLDWCYSCSNMKRALEKKDELLKKYPQVAVRDNATRKEEVFSQDAKEKDGEPDSE